MNRREENRGERKRGKERLGKERRIIIVCTSNVFIRTTCISAYSFKSCRYRSWASVNVQIKHENGENNVISVTLTVT